MNDIAPPQPSFHNTNGVAGAQSRSNRDTFGGDDGVASLATATNAMTVEDGMPVSKSVWENNKAIPNGVVNGTVNGHSNGALTNELAGKENQRPIPIVAVSSVGGGGSRPRESPALNMPGGPPVNSPVPGEPRRPGLPDRPSRSYKGQPPPVITQYERPLEEPIPRRTSTQPSVAALEQRPSVARTSSRKSRTSNNMPVVAPIYAGAPQQDLATTAPQNSLGGAPPQQLSPVDGPQNFSAAPPQQNNFSAAPPQNNVSPPQQNNVSSVTPATFPMPPGQSATSPVPDPYDYEQARSNFYSVPDPTRPETAQAYREAQDSYTDLPMDANGPETNTHHVPPIVPVPMQMNARQGPQQPGPGVEPMPRQGLQHPESGAEPMPIFTHDTTAANTRANAQAVPPSGYGSMRSQTLSPSASARRQPLSPSASMRRQPLSPSASMRHQRLPPIRDSGVAIGEVMPYDRQQQLQTTGSGALTPQRHQLVDDGPIQRPASGLNRSRSFGYRPQPMLVEDEFGGKHEYGNKHEGFFAPDHRGGFVGRSNTTVSRANTMGRNGTLSRASNGGTVGRRAGAFGMGAGLSVGTQPEEVLGREDIHSRADAADRQLDRDTLRRLSQMEKKDARKLEKLMKEEERSQAKGLEHSIRDLRNLTKMQKEAIAQERKSQARLAKWTGREHRARMRFLKEKERYEKVEGELKGAENDFEERRDHAAGLTAQIAERTQEIDDLRAQKAADDRERRVKKHAMRNPAYA